MRYKEFIVTAGTILLYDGFRLSRAALDRSSILKALEPIANVCSIIYMLNWMIVELGYNDGRVYEVKSLPGTVSSRIILAVTTPFLSPLTTHRGPLSPPPLPPTAFRPTFIPSLSPCCIRKLARTMASSLGIWWYQSSVALAN